MKAFQKPLSISQEKYYLQKYQEGDSQAKNILIEHNLRLVAHVVKKYQGTGEDTDDLISIGTIGLIKAVTTFNPQKASRLSTYAARCIENELLMYFRAKKKHSKEVSLYEPIGTDKEGNQRSDQDCPVAEYHRRRVHQDTRMGEEVQQLSENRQWLCLFPQSLYLSVRRWSEDIHHLV